MERRAVFSANSRTRILQILSLYLIHIHFSSLVTCTNVTTSEKPLALATSRLPSVFQSIISNLTSSAEEAATTNTKKVVPPAKEVREPSTQETAPTAGKNITVYYEPSSTPTDQKFVSIGDYKQQPKLFAPTDYLETGFMPFVPSPPYVAEEKPIYEEQSETGNSADTHVNFGSPQVIQEQFFPPGYSNFPTSYGEMLYGEGGVNLPYSKINDKETTLPFITTYAPPKINPMQRPTLYHKGKKYPYIASQYGKSYHFGAHHQPYHFNKVKFPSDFSGLLNEFPDNSHSYNAHKYQAYIDRKIKKSSLLHVLATLLPIGLFLSALPPKIIFINSTNPTPTSASAPRPQFKILNENLPEFSSTNNTVLSLIENLILQTSTDSDCDKRRFCEAFLSSETDKKDSFEEFALQELLSQSPNSVAEKLHLEDLFEAIRSKQCEKFSCSEENATIVKAGQNQNVTNTLLYNVLNS